MFQGAGKRLLGELTTSAPSSMKIKVVASPVRLCSECSPQLMWTSECECGLERPQFLSCILPQFCTTLSLFVSLVTLHCQPSTCSRQKRLAVLLAGEVVGTDHRHEVQRRGDRESCLGEQRGALFLVRGADGKDAGETALGDLAETDASDVISGQHVEVARNDVQTEERDRESCEKCAVDPTPWTRLQTDISEERCVHSGSERAKKLKIDHPDRMT